MMTTTEPSQPLTGFELDNIEGRWQRYVALRDEDSMETSVHDVPDLIVEVDRLRAELALTVRARDYLATRLENQIEAHARTTQKLENAYAERALLFSALDQSGKGQASG